MNRALLGLGILLTAAPFVRAHPVPKNNHDRTVVVHLTPTAVVVDYRLELDELTAVTDLPRSEWASLTERREIYPVFLRYFAPVLADNLVAKLDDRPLTFTCVSKRFTVLDHLRCDYRFTAKWEPRPDKEQVFTLREGNYELDSASKLLLSMTGEDALSLRRVTAPSALLQAKAPEDRGPGDGDRLRTLSATFVVEPEPPLADFKGGLPPDFGPDRAGPEEGQIVGVSKPARRGEAATARIGRAEGEPAMAKAGPLPRSLDGPSSPALSDEPQPTDPANHTYGVLDVLLASRYGLAMALLLATGLGAAHALTPGHGKTLVAAYLVGQRGTVWHACLLGLVTTVTHTSVVLLLATALWLYFGSRVPPGIDRIISLVGGFMIAGLGLWLLMRRLSGRADHVHLDGSHSHGGHSHSHSHGDHHHHHHHLPPGVGLGPLVWLGIAGGIVPCWDAIALLIAALHAGMVWLGPILILAFSAGLASVLIGIGIGVVCARRQVDAVSGQSERLRQVVRVLPLLSAVVVTALGLWMCYDSVQGLK